MYIVNKIVWIVTNPMSLLLIIGMIAIVLACFRRVRVAVLLGCTGILWQWLWMMPLMFRIIGAPLEHEFLKEGRVPIVESFPHADAIVLLGGSIDVNTNLNSYGEMSSSADRIWQAARLWKAGKASIIIATSSGGKDGTGDLLHDLGIPDEKIVFLEKSRNTEEEAKEVQKWVQKMSGCLKPRKSTILLVTSAWHMKRARLMFEKYAPDVGVICAPADFEYSYKVMRPFSLCEILPDTGAIIGNCIALHEWIGLWGYRLFR